MAALGNMGYNTGLMVKLCNVVSTVCKERGLGARVLEPNWSESLLSGAGCQCFPTVRKTSCVYIVAHAWFPVALFEVNLLI